jgi:glucose/mannose-6-phosphate isomerase
VTSAVPFDELLLDDVDLVARRDEGRLLWALASVGASVRRAVELRDEFGVARLADDQPPRAVLVSTDLAAGGAAAVLARVCGPAAPTIAWGGVELPRWAGPADALLIGSTDGRHPRLVRLVEQAEHRGLAIAIAAPIPSPVAQAAGRAPLAALPQPVHARAARWHVLAPLLQAADVLGLVAAPDSQLHEIADALDEAADSCRPSSDAFTNPAKMLAAELAETVPIIAGAGPLASVAARLIGEALQLFAGIPAVAVSLPDGVALAGALLRGDVTDPFEAEQDPTAFFADRATERLRLPRLVTVGDDGAPDDPALGERTGAEVQLDEIAGRRAAAALHGIATQRGLRSSRVDAPLTGTALTRFAAATQFGDFTAAYLALGFGIDPSEPRPGELPR